MSVKTYMPNGKCSGCGDVGPLPPFGDGMCFLCATDGPPGEFTATGGAVGEDDDVRRNDDIWAADDPVTVEVLEIFAEAQRQGAESLGANFADRFCFQSTPNASTRARWLTRHARPDPVKEAQRTAKRASKAKRTIERKGQKRSEESSGLVTIAHDGAIVVSTTIGWRPLVGRRGAKRQPDSVLSRTVTYVLEHHGCTTEDVATSLGVSHRQAAKALYAAMEGGRVLRSGTHGRSRFCPGPMATLQPHCPLPNKQAQLSCLVSEATLIALEGLAAHCHISLGTVIEELTAGVSSLIQPICDTAVLDV